MSRARRDLAIGLALGLLATTALAATPAPTADPKASAEGLRATRALVAKLAASGRGETAVTVTVADLMGGPDRVERGRLALEPPDRARLDLPVSGEKLAVRGDGGEWVQPSARQLIRLTREQAGLAAWLWGALLEGGRGDFIERATGERTFVLEPRDPESGLPERVTVTLDASGLPASVEFEEAGGGATRYRFDGWRFRSARGASAFRLTAPSGYHVVDLP